MAHFVLELLALVEPADIPEKHYHQCGYVKNYLVVDDLAKDLRLLPEQSTQFDPKSGFKKC